MADLPPNPAPHGLPPVVAPSGRMIAQMFVIPGVIVIGVVTIILGFTWLAGGARTASDFLLGLRNANPEVRWRAASDLAQVLQRDDVMAADPQFGLQLAAQLQDALATMRKPAPPRPENVEVADRREAAQERMKFENLRAEAQYLTACLGSLSIPVGAPLLANMAGETVSPDAETDALLRRQAAWALGRLGNNLGRFDQLSDERRAELLKTLDEHAAKAGDQANWAQAAVDALRGSGTAGAVAGLAKCAEADDPFLRKQAALALSFWAGGPADIQLAETTLMRLTRDSGQGESIRLEGKR